MMNIENKVPWIAKDSWVAPNATIIGDVEIGNDSSVWYGSVVRGTKNDRVDRRTLDG